MKTRFAVPVVLLALLAVIPAAPAAAVECGLGADLGFNLFIPSSDYEGAENISTFGWPMGGSFLGALPTFGGLRVSFRGEKPAHEVWLGTSLSFLSSEGDSFHQLGLTANYQYNFPTQGTILPYVTAGAGLNMVGINPDEGDSHSATAAVFGGGVGIARAVADGAGRLRAEVRFDQVTEGESDGSVMIPKGGNLGIRLGFDLWLK